VSEVDVLNIIETATYVRYPRPTDEIAFAIHEESKRSLKDFFLSLSMMIVQECTIEQIVSISVCAIAQDGAQVKQRRIKIDIFHGKKIIVSDNHGDKSWKPAPRGQAQRGNGVRLAYLAELTSMRHTTGTFVGNPTYAPLVERVTDDYWQLH
jgi:hypothetical protein